MDIIEEIEFSQILLDGLSFLNSEITEEISKKLLLNAVKQLLLKGLSLPPKPELYATKAEFSKQAEYAICSTLIIASKHQLTSLKLKDLLTKNKIHTTTVNQLIELYEKHKEGIIFKLTHYGTSHNLAKLTNVNWELTCDVGNEAELNYKINLQTFNHDTGDYDSITEFLCNPEELQSLVNQFKEIERHCEKIGQIK